jgi:tetratricopeptide (TPR) repeat protein
MRLFAPRRYAFGHEAIVMPDGCHTVLGHLPMKKQKKRRSRRESFRRRLTLFSRLEIGLSCVVLMAGVISLSTAIADELSQQQIYNNFGSAYRAGEMDQARTWAAKLLEVKQTKYGQDSPELIVSLINLAGVDLQLMDWAGSETSASRALSILDAQPNDILAHRLILMKMLASAQLGLGRRDAASDTLNAALATNKRQKPVNQLYRAEIYAMYVEIAKLEIDVKDGNRACSKALDATTKHYGKGSVELVPAIEDAAGWYRFSSQLSTERKMHRRSIEILEQHYGPSDASLANPLRGIASSYMIERKSPKKGLAALERAVALDFSDSTEAVLLQSNMEAELGDYLLLFGDPGASTEAYRKSWRMMASHDELGAGYANRYFDEPVRIYYDQPSTPANTGKGADYFTEGYVLMEFTVGVDGTLTDLEIVESKPREMKELLFFRALRKARYRPRVIDGEPVATGNVQLRNAYRETNR